MSQQFTSETINDLFVMLTYGRPHRSEAEAAFVQRYINPLPNVSYDKFGNGLLRIGTAPVLFSCHTDTVHHKSGRQRIIVKEGIAQLRTPKRGLCLGADDTAGVWLMREMIFAGVSGLYIFHAGEEHGGLGSNYIAKNHASMLREFDVAIAFDRKGTNSVITHQGGRSCSDAFARSLCKLLGTTWRLDDTGTFTDTANYVDHIAECTNISVGYEGAHGPSETLDTWFLSELRNVLVNFDASGLTIARIPGEHDVDSWLPNYRGSLFSGAYAPVPRLDSALIELCRDYPEIAARLIEDMGLSATDMIEACRDAGFSLDDM